MVKSYGITWNNALQKYNYNKNAWCSPRKGTAEHQVVKDIFETMKEEAMRKQKKPEPKPAPAPKPKPKPEPKPVKKPAKKETKPEQQPDEEFDFSYYNKLHDILGDYYVEYYKNKDKPNIYKMPDIKEMKKYLEEFNKESKKILKFAKGEDKKIWEWQRKTTNNIINEILNYIQKQQAPKEEPKEEPEPEPEEEYIPPRRFIPFEPAPKKEEPKEEPKANNNIRNEEELKSFFDNYNYFKSARQQANIKKVLEKITTKDNYEGLLNLLVSSKRYNDFFPTPKSCLDSEKAVNVIKQAEHIYEPTAGLGSLIYGAYKINPNVKISANELMKDNADFIRYNFPNCKTTTEDFLKMDVKPNDYDLYLLNPPFTKGGDKRFYLNFLFKAFEFMDNYKYNDTPNMIFFSPQLTEKKDRGEKVGDIVLLENLRNLSNKKKLELYNEYKGENLKKLTKDEDDMDEFEYLIYEDLPIQQIEVIDTCKFQTTGVKVYVYLIIGTRDPSKPKRP